MIEYQDSAAWKRLGERMAAERAERGISQDEAAAGAKVSPTTWRDLENGRKTSARMLTLAAIGVFLDWGADGPAAILMGTEPEISLRNDVVDAQVLALAEELNGLADRLATVEELLAQIAEQAPHAPGTPTARNEAEDARPAK